MIFFQLNNKLHRLVLSVVTIAIVTACGTTMEVVNKSLDDGQFVPVEATTTRDFLNEYDLHLPRPQHQRIGIDVAMERPNVLAGGDTLYAQIALTTKRPTVEKKQIHVLAFNPEGESLDHLDRFKKAIKVIKSGMKHMPAGSKLTIDWFNPVKDDKYVKDPLLKHSGNGDLVAFLGAVAKLQLEGRHHHYILLLGNDAILTHEQKQNIIDIASILQVESATLSVLFVGQTPEVSFLASAAKKGDGVFAPVTKGFDYSRWYKNYIKYVSAKTVSNIKFRINPVNNADIESVESPESVVINDKRINQVVPILREGDQYALVLRLKTAQFTSQSVVPVVHVVAEYFDQEAQRYIKVNKTATVHVVNDRNELLTDRNSTIERSRLILATQRVLQNVVPVIQDKRYYQAIALLTAQSRKLKHFARQHDDAVLIRDAATLDRYSSKLYGYDQTFFQTISLWHDFSYEAGRYSEQFD